MRSTEDKIISAVLSWHDSNESDSPEDIGVMRHKIRAAIEADMAQPALVEVAKMVEIDDGLGTVFIEFYPGRRPKAGTKIFAQPVEPVQPSAAFWTRASEFKTAQGNHDYKLPVNQEYDEYNSFTMPLYAQPVQPALLDWAVEQWQAQVGSRPDVPRQRLLTLDSVWRQVMRYAGGDPDKLVGPRPESRMRGEYIS